MGTIFKTLIIALWLPQAIGQLLNWTYWWQVKEYRIDRFRVFFASYDGRKNLSLYFICIKLLALFLSLCLYEFFWLALFIIFVLDVSYFIKIARKSIRKPAFTKRMQKIFCTSLVFVFAVSLSILLFSSYQVVNLLLIGEVFLITTPLLGIVWTKLIVERIKKEEIIKAKRILTKVKPIAIGITGSYGKTTTKDFVVHLLSQKYKVAKTKGNQNTEFGISRNVASEVKKDTEFFVAEMGAYKIGEIKKLCDIVNPSVGILTGIEPQHLSLFGSLGNIEKAKYELIESLPRDGLALFNLSNSYCQQLSRKAKSRGLRVLTYLRSDNPRKHFKPDILIGSVSANEKGVKFEVCYKKYKKVMFAPVRGVHFLENLAAAILIARDFKVGWNNIKKACQSIKTPDKTMKVYKKGEMIIIDDSYNNTPHGFKAALEYLLLFKEVKKIVITPGIIELGKETEKVHESLARRMVKFVDKIVLTKKDAQTYFRKVFKEDKDKLLVIDEDYYLKKLLENLVKKKCVVLLEGRMPSLVTNYINKILKK